MENHVGPIHGRLVIRKLADGHSALVGIAHLPQAFVPVEGVAYLATTFEGKFHVYSTALDTGLDESIAGQGVQAMLRAPIWRTTSVPDTVPVRFIEAFPETNSWTVIGAAVQPLVRPDQYDQSGHAWLEIMDGWLKKISPGVTASGLQMSQLLTTFPVWPDFYDKLHTLPEIEGSYRQAYFDNAVNLARYGAGEIDLTTLQDLTNGGATIFSIRHLNVDTHYARYLAALRTAGALKIDGPISIDDIPAKHAASMAAIKKCEDIENDVEAPPSRPRHSAA